MTLLTRGLGGFHLTTGGLLEKYVFVTVIITDVDFGILEEKWDVDTVTGKWTLADAELKWLTEETANLWEIGDIYIDMRSNTSDLIVTTGKLTAQYAFNHPHSKWLVDSAALKWEDTTLTSKWNVSDLEMSGIETDGS